ncbi:peptidoglycan-recognition protein SA-like isoform X2 [Ostrinia nubilalis]|uniref:peptidoglycan-recognition protein SA-like isoform X2 n=1 Tax=Ostrinia furnacalis TaxID=93504 RepID=UPI00103EBF7F|nr:peptidoglycan-recognition protein SA-like isoform X2 [Ostrinia furnacalis]
MALKQESHNDSKLNSLGIKVKGDLGDLQIVENSGSECSDDDERTVDRKQKAHVLQTISTIPTSLIQNRTEPIVSNVQVHNSENIQFGHNTYFHGPVTIKQIIKKKGIDNASYTSDNENEHNATDSTQDADPPPMVNNVSPWLKMTLSITIVIVLGIVCVLVLYMQSHNKDEISSSHDDSEKVSTTDPLLISPNHLRIVSRTDWLAQPVESELQKIRQPVPWVVITHTATEPCSYQSECVLRVRLIQMFHIEAKKWDDIGYNFLVAGDGSAYFGRGWEYIGAHTLGYNRYSIGIAFVGTFNSETPPKKQIEACQKLIKLGVQQGKIAKDYKLFAHRQLTSTLSPGDRLYDIIKQWPHFVKEDTNIDDIVPKNY